MKEFDHQQAGISALANEIPGIYLTEAVTCAFHTTTTAKKGLPMPKNSLTTNADVLISKWQAPGSEVITHEDGSKSITSAGGMNSHLIFNPDGTLKMVQSFSPEKKKLFARLGETISDKMAQTEYIFVQKPELSFTSIAACCELEQDELGRRISNISWLDRLPWIEHPKLQAPYTVVWSVYNSSEKLVSPALVIEMDHLVDGSTVVTVRPMFYKHIGEVQPMPRKKTHEANFGANTVMLALGLEYDLDADRATYDEQNNVLTVNPSLLYADIQVRIEPLGMNNKTEDDDSVTLSLMLSDEEIAAL